MQPGAPKLSLVLVVHREQAWLEEFAASALAQGFGAVELVCVDDASPDHAPEMLDELAARDARVRVLHLAAPVGRGEARNRGLQAARGDYVWFVRATDLLPMGSLAAVADRLVATSPDVLFVHHARRDLLGSEREGPYGRVLERIARGGTAADGAWPAIADLARHTWDKVFRRALLEDAGRLAAGSRPQCDLALLWPALLAAETVDALPTVSYVRREPPGVARSGDEEAAGFDVFAHYDAAFSAAEERGDIPTVRRSALAAAMLRHELTLLRGLPAKDRREFLSGMSQGLRRHVEERPAAGGRRAGLYTSAVERDSYLAFVALELARRARGRLRRSRTALATRRRRRRKRARRKSLRRYYRSRLRQPIDPNLAIFAAYWYRGYSCNPRAIYEKARELVPGFRGVWVVNPGAETAVPPGVEHVIAGTREYYDVIARAGYFVNNVNFPNDVVKREGTVHVMTHHGTPLKLMGLDERRSPVSRTNFAALMRRCARWDYSISSNPHSTLIWERVYPMPYETLEVGYPRNDALAASTDADVQRLRAELGIRAGQIAILYAPTHRDHERSFVPTLDLQAVADQLGTNYVLLSRAHYFYGANAGSAGLRRDGAVRDVAGHPSIEELCLAADVLVTDYSSIMFDYAVLDRPIVIHAPDWEAYQAVRGTYFDVIAEAPGVATRTEAELVDAFRSGEVWGHDGRRARAAFRARFCTLEDGRAAERVVQRVWPGQSRPERSRRPLVAAAASGDPE
jgi:CDP-glycerol glycerophosphotransferase